MQEVSSYELGLHLSFPYIREGVTRFLCIVNLCINGSPLHGHAVFFLFRMPPKGRPRGQPTSIGGDVFYGNDNLSPEQLEALRFSNSSDFIEENIQWNGGLLGTIALSISNDNLLVEDSHVVLVGGIFDEGPKVFASTRFFDGPPMKFIIHEIDASAFSFNNSCVSEFIDSAVLNFEFKDSLAGPALSKQALQERGISGFCIRMFLAPIEPLYVKAWISLYPLPLESLLEDYLLAKNAAFPGCQLFSGSFPLGPSQTDVFSGLNWGLPFLPCLLSDTVFSSSDACPSSVDLRAALCSLLRSAAAPDHKKNFSSLQDAWEKVQDEGESSLKPTSLQLIWPLPKAPMQPRQGKSSAVFSMFIFISTLSRFSLIFSPGFAYSLRRFYFGLTP